MSKIEISIRKINEIILFESSSDYGHLSSVQKYKLNENKKYHLNTVANELAWVFELFKDLYNVLNTLFEMFWESLLTFTKGVEKLYWSKEK